MKQINFFSPFMDKHQKNHKSRKLIVILSTTIVFVLAVLTYNVVAIVDLNMQINDINAYLQDPANIEKAKESKTRLDSMNIINEYVGIVQPVVTQLEKDNIVDKSFLDKLSVAKVGLVTVQQMTYAQNSLKISGVSTDKKLIASYLYKLKVIGLFDSVKLNSMSSDGGVINFDIDCTFEGGGTVANN